MRKFDFWQTPRDANMEIGNENRRVSWLELFFDIFFVCAIAAVSHILVKDMTIDGFFAFALTIIPVWWIWIGFTYYNERFETFGVENRLFTFLMMIPVAGMAIFAHHALGDTFKGFALSYAFARVILGFLYARAGVHVDDFRTTGFIYGFCFFISVLVITLSVFFLPANVALYVFGAALVFDLSVPFIATTFDGTFEDPEPINISDKINERFGLFCIIVIGEMIVAVINGLSQLEHPGANDLLLGLASLAVAFGMWWVYFDFIGRRGTAKKAIKIYVWTYLHMPLVMSLLALSAGILHSIEHPGHLDATVRLLIGLSSGFTLIFIGLIEWVSHRHHNEPTGHVQSSGLKFLTGAALIIIGKQTQLETAPLILIIFAMLALNMMYGMWAWFKVPADSDYNTDYTG